MNLPIIILTILLIIMYTYIILQYIGLPNNIAIIYTSILCLIIYMSFFVVRRNRNEIDLGAIIILLSLMSFILISTRYLHINNVISDFIFSLFTTLGFIVYIVSFYIMEIQVQRNTLPLFLTAGAA